MRPPVRLLRHRVVLATIVILGLASGCSDNENPTAPLSEPREMVRIATPNQSISADWSAYVLSEVRYALSRARTGRSTLTYVGCYMGDWNYVTGGSDNSAYEVKRREYAGAYGTGPVGFATYELGGWCKFFADLVLYRSSYGLGGGWHLCLPSGYTYATVSVRSAAPGWVVQSALPHTAIIESPYRDSRGVQIGWWLIDSNWIGSGGQYRYWVGRHAMTYVALENAGLKAWRPNLVRLYP